MTDWIYPELRPPFENWTPPAAGADETIFTLPADYEPGRDSRRWLYIERYGWSRRRQIMFAIADRFRKRP